MSKSGIVIIWDMCCNIYFSKHHSNSKIPESRLYQPHVQYMVVKIYKQIVLMLSSRNIEPYYSVWIIDWAFEGFLSEVDHLQLLFHQSSFHQNPIKEILLQKLFSLDQWLRKYYQKFGHNSKRKTWYVNVLKHRFVLSYNIYKVQWMGKS